MLSKPVEQRKSTAIPPPPPKALGVSRSNEGASEQDVLGAQIITNTIAGVALHS